MADAAQPPPTGDIAPIAPQKQGIAEWMRSHLLLTILGAFLLGAIAGASGSEGGQQLAADQEETSPAAEEEEEDEPETTVEEEPEPEPEPQFDRPSKDDFSLKLKKTSEACFGSAGCNVEVRLVLSFANPIELDPSKTYELRYRIVGAEDPLLETTEISGRDYVPNEHFVSTTSASANLQAVVLSVSEF